MRKIKIDSAIGIFPPDNWGTYGGKLHTQHLLFYWKLFHSNFS